LVYITKVKLTFEKQRFRHAFKAYLRIISAFDFLYARYDFENII